MAKPTSAFFRADTNHQTQLTTHDGVIGVLCNRRTPTQENPDTGEPRPSPQDIEDRHRKSSPGWRMPHLAAMALAVLMLSPVTILTVMPAR
ncbi:hypothetical protein EYF80_001750 [Liparis tanakae]|uniref:Uncharacterized protein n=1 Tax=Liparis tanakae TaxID=230148 RepID=A0A4Z2JD65_9TELE|nr:hypothetical protein EYF80_001750 [Liparis tanakae]